MSTEKPTPTPATDEEIANFKRAHSRCSEEYCEIGNNLMAGGLTAGNLLARIEADRAKILPSSCSSSHPEIRYQGAECPLCEALKVLRKLEWSGPKYEEGGIDRGPICPSCGRHKYGTGYSQHEPGGHKKNCALAAALSRLSSDPGAGEVGK